MFCMCSAVGHMPGLHQGDKVDESGGQSQRRHVPREFCDEEVVIAWVVLPQRGTDRALAELISERNEGWWNI